LLTAEFSCLVCLDVVGPMATARDELGEVEAEGVLAVLLAERSAKVDPVLTADLPRDSPSLDPIATVGELGDPPGKRGGVSNPEPPEPV
jgi:hypothetical protein